MDAGAAVYLATTGPGAFDRLAQRMDRDLLALISTLSSLHVYVARQGPALDAAPMIYLAPAAERLAPERSG